MNLSHWYKKDVVLEWRRQRLSFAVSQSLFSSHDIDAGSRLLLRSLDPDSLPIHGTAIDYGCGYGVLGLALKQAMPRWTVELIDRDALAAAFSDWNANRLGWSAASGVRCRVGLGVETAPAAGVDLLLWNVPGKAGPRVLAQLAKDAIGVVARDGLLALVVVNPLANGIRATIAVDTTMSVEADATHADHTVILARRTQAPPDGLGEVGPPFARGVFDRAEAEFEWKDFVYTLTPVIGLPEYDSRDFATDCALDAIRGIPQPTDRVILHGVGQGHLPVLLSAMHRPRRMDLIDRDLLALEASTRALRHAGMPPECIGTHDRADIGQIEGADGSMLVVIMLPDQQPQGVSAMQISSLSVMAGASKHVVVAGSSTSVTRFLALAPRTGGWRLLKRRKRHGASAALLSIDGG